MATTNVSIARGLIPYRKMDGSYYNGAANVYYVPAAYATALYVGDPVDVISGSNDANGIPAVALGVVASPIVGSVIGIVAAGEPIIPVTRDLPVYRPASVATYILVADDPALLFWIQDDASAQARASSQWAGRNANMVSGTGSTITGFSGWQMASSTVATTNTLDLKIMRPLPQADNAVSSTANTNQNAKWLVKLNNHRLSNQIAGV